MLCALYTVCFRIKWARWHLKVSPSLKQIQMVYLHKSHVDMAVVENSNQCWPKAWHWLFSTSNVGHLETKQNKKAISCDLELWRHTKLWGSWEICTSVWKKTKTKQINFVIVIKIIMIMEIHPPWWVTDKINSLFSQYHSKLKQQQHFRKNDLHFI